MAKAKPPKPPDTGRPPHPYDSVKFIVGPRDGMRDCGSREAYYASHMRQMQLKMQRHPHLGAKLPFAAGSLVPFIVGGKWVVACPCGDYPMAQPQWDEARCFNCGAHYKDLQWPPKRDKIEKVLLARRSAWSRSWKPQYSLEELIAENLEQGDPVPDAKELTDGDIH